MPGSAPVSRAISWRRSGSTKWGQININKITSSKFNSNSQMQSTTSKRTTKSNGSSFEEKESCSAMTMLCPKTIPILKPATMTSSKPWSSRRGSSRMPSSETSFFQTWRSQSLQNHWLQSIQAAQFSLKTNSTCLGSMQIQMKDMWRRRNHLKESVAVCWRKISSNSSPPQLTQTKAWSIETRFCLMLLWNSVRVKPSWPEGKSRRSSWTTSWWGRSRPGYANRIQTWHCRKRLRSKSRGSSSLRSRGITMLTSGKTQIITGRKTLTTWTSRQHLEKNEPS